MKFLGCILCLALAAGMVRAQTQQSGWLASINTIRINDQYSLLFDAQVRSTDDLEQTQTVILRPGLNRHLTRNLSASAGYAFILNRRTEGGASALLAEHRIWEQLLYNHRLKRAFVSHRLRVEQRFLPIAVARANRIEADGFRDAYRLRYFIRKVTPLTKGPQFERGFFLALQNEVFAHVGDKSAVNGRFFDQNRFYAAAGYRLPRKLDVEIGYMNQHVKNRSSSLNNHIVQLAIYRRP